MCIRDSLKTGALIHASVMLGVVSADVTTTAAYQVLSNFGRELGLAFQIQDDILDVEGQTDQLGKRVGADAALEKPTYPSVFGLEEARRPAPATPARPTARTPREREPHRSPDFSTPPR